MYQILHKSVWAPEGKESSRCYNFVINVIKLTSATTFRSILRICAICITQNIPAATPFPTLGFLQSVTFLLLVLHSWSIVSPSVHSPDTHNVLNNLATKISLTWPLCELMRRKELQIERTHGLKICVEIYFENDDFNNMCFRKVGIYDLLTALTFVTREKWKFQ
jgi:hypothetical protein